MLKLLKLELKEKSKKLRPKRKLLKLKLTLIEKKSKLLLNKEESSTKPLKKLRKLIKENLNQELMLPLKLELPWLKSIRLNLKNN